MLEWESNCILIYLSRELILITFYLQTRNANDEYINSSEVRQCGKSKVYLFIFRMLCVSVKNTKLKKVLTFRRVSWLEDRGQINLISSISCFQDDTRPA